MKNLFLYLLVFGTFLLNASHTLLINKNQNCGYLNTSLKTSFSKFEISKSVPSVLKTDLIDDFDNDNEDDDLQSTQIKNNNLIATFFSFKNKAIALSFVPKKTLDKNYFSSNFSNFPRFNYISLNVFLI